MARVTPLEKSDFPFPTGGQFKSLLSYRGTLCPLPHSGLRFCLVWTRASLVHVKVAKVIIFWILAESSMIQLDFPHKMVVIYVHILSHLSPYIDSSILLDFSKNKHLDLLISSILWLFPFQFYSFSFQSFHLLSLIGHSFLVYWDGSLNNLSVFFNICI